MWSFRKNSQQKQPAAGQAAATGPAEPPALPSDVRRPLGSILVDHGIISEGQLQQALAYQQRESCRLGRALCALNLCTEIDIARALADQNGIPFVDLEETPPDPQALQLIAPEVAAEHQIIPVCVRGNRLLLVASDPYDLRIDDVVRRTLGRPALVAAAPASQIAYVLAHYDQLRWATPSARRAVSFDPTSPVAPHLSGAPGLPAAPVSPRHLPPSATNAQTVQKVNALIASAVRKRAREIYFDPGRDGLRVRCRIDGQVHLLTTVPSTHAEGVLARLQLIGSVNLAQPSPAPGRCRMRVDGSPVEWLTWAIRTDDGGSLLFRLVDTDRMLLTLEELGLESEMFESVQELLADRQGMILVNGPAGSGMPATLYALLNHLKIGGSRVFALDSTFERKVTGFNRVQIGASGAYSLSSAMSLCLNQDPEAILVGDLPDRETAEVACRAASTGQMVIAGSRAPDALTALHELVNLGAAPHLVASSLKAVLSQRLLRRVCDRCASDSPLPFVLERAFRSTFGPAEGRYRKGRGCAECNQLGSRGCIGVFELVIIDPDFRRLLADRAAPSVMEQHFRGLRAGTLEEDAYRKSCRGLIAPDELQFLNRRLAGMLQGAAGQTDGPSTFNLDDPSWNQWQPPAAQSESAELESWDAVADMAQLLGAGGGSVEFLCQEPEAWPPAPSFAGATA